MGGAKIKGHVRERGKGNWYAVLSMRDPQTGKRKVKFVSLPDCKGKREAQSACASIIAKLQEGAFVDPSKAALSQFLDRWLDHIQTQVSPRTYGRYVELVRGNICPLLGTSRLTKLRPEHISDAYARALAGGRRDGRGLSSQTVRHMHTVLKQALGQACLWRAIARNPAALVKPPKLEHREMQVYDTAQAAAMLDAARGTSLLVPLTLAVLCGLRRGEIAALRWRAIDLDNARLSVIASAEQMRGGVREKEPKNGKGRLVALPPMAVTELKRHRVQQAEMFLKLGVRLSDDRHVVCREDGEPLWPSSIGRAFRTFLRRHRLPQIRLHDLRHSHATHLLAAGVHPKVAQERLGHSSVGITIDLYSHVLPGMQEDAAAKVDAALQLAMNKQETK